MSDALRLADALEQGTYLLSVERGATAAELRRLVAENEALLAETRTLVRQNGEWQVINAELVEALNALLNDVGRANSMLGAVKARAALAKVEAGK